MDGADLLWLDFPAPRSALDAAFLTPAAEEIARLAREKTIDIIHLNAPALAAELNLKRPVIATAHACFGTRWLATRRGPIPEDDRWRVRLDRTGFEAADLVLAPSRSFAEALTNLHGPLPNLRIAPRGSGAGGEAEARRDVVAAEGCWWADGPTLMRLDGAARTASWPIEAIGAFEGPSGEAAPVTEKVARLDGLTREERALRLSSARICLSAPVYAPFGMAALDGARAGCALVLSDIPAHREAWDGAAVFVDPRDPEMIARTLNRLARQPILREILTDAASLKARRYSLDEQAVTVLRAYAEAAAARSAPAARAS